jgi:post-segregation antitoxin (ccd killing protein)
MSPNKPDFTEIRVQLPISVHDELADLARANDRTISAETRRALRYHLMHAHERTEAIEDD